jgi:hypothetical protein
MMQPVSYYYEIAEGHSVTVNYGAFGKARQVVKDSLRDRKSYICEHKSEGWSVMLAKASDRIWEENDQGIRIVKNRFTNDPTVDMKEFFWIKLSSREL